MRTSPAPTSAVARYGRDVYWGDRGRGRFGTTTGFTSSQLYSTLSYSQSDLHGIGLGCNNLANWNFAGQNLTGANLSYGTLNGTNLLLT